MAERVVTMRWRGQIAAFMQDETPEIDLEGGLSSGKTTACLWKVWNRLQQEPGIHIWIGRYGDGETQTKVRPAFEQVCQQGGGVPSWNAKELCYEFDNGSKCFSYGLKSPDALSRYSKMRGMGVSGIYLDQTEELPEDFSGELRLRLRQPGYRHQLIFSPNPPNVTHWLAQQFPEDNRHPSRRYYGISIHDNAHNLPPELIQQALLAYPPDHAKHRSVILGRRGMNVTGDPVYKGAFLRSAHVQPLTFDERLPLLISLDYGKHHPCVLFAQRPYHGGWRLLGGLMGKDVFLDDFMTLVKEYMSAWFPAIPQGVQMCCDPAGTHQNSQGSRFTGVDIVRRFGFSPSWRMNANAPDVRAAAIESLSAHMRRRTPSGEAFAIEADPQHWLLVSIAGAVAEPFLSDGMEAGYVWDEHMVSVGNKQIRKPKKDGWFEHGANCLSGDTVVWTSAGRVKIADLVGASGYVLSQAGEWRRFINCRLTRKQAAMVRVSFEDGHYVDCTPDHRFWTIGGWVHAYELHGKQCYNAVCQAIRGDNIQAEHFRSLEGSAITSAKGVTTSATANGSIVSFGNLSTDLSLTAGMFTTETGIGITTTSPTWKPFRVMSTLLSTAQKAYRSLCRVLRLKPAGSGTAPKLDSHGTSSTGNSTRSTSGISPRSGNATSVAWTSSPSSLQHELTFSVSPHADKPIDVFASWTMSAEHVLSAVPSSSVSDTLHSAAARGSVLARCVGVSELPPEDVYCLDVPSTQMFAVAHGVLVHNCAEYLEITYGAERPTQEVSERKAAAQSTARPYRPSSPWG